MSTIFTGFPIEGENVGPVQKVVDNFDDLDALTASSLNVGRYVQRVDTKELFKRVESGGELTTTGGIELKRARGLEYDTFDDMSDNIASGGDDTVFTTRKYGAVYVEKSSDPDTEKNGVPLTMVARWNNTYTPDQLGLNTSDDFSDAARAEGLQKLVTVAAARGKEVLIPSDPETWKIDTPLSLWDNTCLHIDGVLESSDDCFQIGNHHPAYWPSDGSKMTWYNCASVVSGETVALDSGTNRTNAVAALSVGDTVFIRSEKYYVGAGSHERPLYAMAAIVLNIDEGSGVITLDRGMPEDYGDCLIGLPNDASVTALLGDALFFPKNVRVEGPGKLIAAEDILSRGGFIDSLIHVAEMEATTGFYCNAMMDSFIRFDRMTITEKLLDCAGNSTRTVMEAGTVIVQGGGATSALAVMNENSADCQMKIGELIAGEWDNTNGNFKFISTRRCGIEAGNIALPKSVSSCVLFTASDYTKSGNEDQPTTTDNWFNLCGNAHLGDSLDRFVYETSDGVTSGGDLAAQRNRVTGGHWFGTQTTGRAAEIGGLNTFLKDMVCESGELRLSSTSDSAIIQNCHFPDDISYIGGDHLDHEISGLVSNKTQAFKAASTKSGNESTSSTAEVIFGDTGVIPVGNFVEGDMIKVVIMGEVSGTTGTKEISLNIAVDTDDDGDDLDGDDDSNKISLTIPAAAGDWVAEFGAVFQSSAIMPMTGQLKCASAPDIQVQRFTGMDTANFPVRIEVSGLVQDASDTLTVRSIVRKLTTSESA
jgi:hypothetical protein